MKKGTKIALIIATACIVLGSVLSLSTSAMIDADLSRLNTITYTVGTHLVSESFSSIYIDTSEADIRLLPSSDDTCSVVCPQGEQITHTVTVENDTLTVQRADIRKWYEHIGIFWDSERELAVTVYLPMQKYASLTLKCTSGEISVPGQFSFSQAKISTTSGDINYCANTGGALSLSSTSGDLTIHDLTAEQIKAQSTSGSIGLSEINAAKLKTASTSGDVDLSNVLVDTQMELDSTSGSIDLAGVTAAELKAASTSGDIDLSNVLAATQMELDSTSGQITLDRCDAQTLQLHSMSGDIFGSLLTEKQFVTNTTSGTVRVPNSSGTDTCRASTTSGNITFNIIDP